MAPVDSEEGEAKNLATSPNISTNNEKSLGARGESKIDPESKLGSLLSRIRGNKEEVKSPSSNSLKGGVSKSIDSFDEESKVVTARGTEDGLVLRIDGKSPWESILGELDAFLGSRKRFLEGGEVSIEWLERLPTPEQSFELEQYLREGFGVEVVSRRRRPAFTTIVDRSASRSAGQGPLSNRGVKGGPNITHLNTSGAATSAEVASLNSTGSSIGTPLTESALEEGLNELQGMDHYDSLVEEENLAQQTSSSGSSAQRKTSKMERVLKDTIEILEDPAGPSYLRRVSKLLGEDLVYEEDANAKIVFGHFRSGQRLETPYSLVVIGDVNPGADLIAGGDIFVLGSLRGTAHAAAYDDEALDRVVVALSMQPVQLRIGSILSRGNGAAGKGPEVARIENRRIIVETFNSRVNLRKKTI